MPDAIVIGAGPNGLVAANLLVDAGWSVQVLEAQDVPGGAVRTAEITEPGFRHDLFSAFYPLGAASRPIRRFAVEEFRGDGAARLVAGNGLHADFGPGTTLGAFFGWLLSALGQDVGFPTPRGGAGALTDALVRRLESKGGTIAYGARVE